MSIGDSTSDWQAQAGIPDQVDQLEVSDPAHLDELSHPVRARILMLLQSPATVAELAARLGVPATRLYHHVAHLERVGMIDVVATRSVRSVTERRYRANARSYTIDQAALQALGPEALGKMAVALFDIVKAELGRAFDGGLDLTPGSTAGMLRLDEVRVGPDVWRQLVRDLAALLDRHTSPDPDGPGHVVFVAAFPSNDEPAS